VAWPEVEGVRVTAEALEISLAGPATFYQRLTDLAADWSGGVQEITPLDDDLAAVFGYLVE